MWWWLQDRALWAEIVIPVISAGATVAAVVAAVITSRQALQIAQAAEARADRDALLQAAADQARLLLDWAHLRRRADQMPPLTSIRGDGESSVSRAYREVRAALLVSDVPGAEIVFALTEHDLDHAWRYSFGANDLWRHYSDLWARRTDGRIAKWARNPKEEVQALEATLARAQEHPRAYARLPLGRGWEEVYSVADAEAGE